jgi:hypothetical protein
MACCLVTCSTEFYKVRSLPSCSIFTILGDAEAREELYVNHFWTERPLSEENISNITCIPLHKKNMVFLLQEFNLIDRRELAPLQELIEKLTAKECRWNASNPFLPSEHLLTTLFNRFCATAVAMLHSDPVSDWNKQTRALLWITTEFTNALNNGILTWYMITPDQASVRSEHILQSDLCVIWRSSYSQKNNTCR